MNTVQNKSQRPSVKRRTDLKRTTTGRLRTLILVGFLILCLGKQSILGQGVGISETSIVPDPSSILELRWTAGSYKGFLAPRMTYANMLAIPSPAQGLLVYATDRNTFYYYNSLTSNWIAIAATSLGTSNQLLGMNLAGTANEYKTLLGTNNQINVSFAPGSITLSTPQDIHSGASPVFVGLTLSGLTPNSGVYTNGTNVLTSTPPSTGILGYWTRTGTTLSPSSAGDAITTTGNIYTTGTGAITSAGLLTGSLGTAITGGIIYLNSSSNFLTNINTGTSTGNVNIGGLSNSIFLPKFTTAGVVHNDATGLLTTGLILNSDITNGTIDLVSKVTGILPIANGGTNSGTALTDNKIIVSSSGQIVEGPAGTVTTLLHGNASGLPTYGPVTLTTDVTGVLPVLNGGTGYNNTYTDGQLLIGNTTGTLTRNTLTGTANQIIITNGDGTIKLATPQDINTTSSPTFIGLTISGLTPNAGVYTDNTSKLTSTPPTTGILGYWTRTGTTLSPTTAGDAVTTIGNISTTGTGTITSAGLLTGTSGAAISGGAINLNSGSNFITNINTGTSTGNINIGGLLNSVFLPKFTTAGVVHNDATGLLSSGQIVNSDIANGTIDLVSKVTGILPVTNGGTGYNNTYTDGQLLIGNTAGTLTRNTLTGTVNQIIITNGDGTIKLATPQDINTTSSPTFTGLTISGLTPNAGVYTDNTSKLTSTPPTTGILGYWTRTGTTLSPTTAGDAVTTIGNISTTGTGTITSAGLLTGTSGAAISGGAINLNSGSNFITNINTGTSTGNINIGGLLNSVFLPKFTTAGVVHNDATGLLSSGQIVNSDIANGTIDLVSKVTGILPIVNGGTNSGTALSGESIMVSDGSAIIQGDKGTVTTVLHGNASGLPTYGPVSLTSDVSNTLPVGNGGTGLSSITANNLIYGNGSGAVNLLAPGAITGALLMNTSAGAPSWMTLNGLPATAGILSIANGGTNSGTALNDNRLMISSGGKIVEASELMDGQVIVGKTGFAPQLVMLGGDATINTTGILILANTLVTPGTYGDGTHVSQFTVDSKGRLTFAASTLITGTSPVGSALTNGHIWIGDATNFAQEALLNGDATITNTGVVTVGRINGATVPISGSLTIGNVLQVSGASSLTYGPINLAGGTNYVSGVLPIVNGGTNSGTALVNNRLMISKGGQIVELGSTLGDGQILVGKAGNDPQTVSMNGDVTINNSGTTIVGLVGGSTAANVHAGELLANAATNLNTMSTIVKRDATGNFSAGTITAALNGNASTATLASTVTTNANLTGPITSVGNATSIASQTGIGTKFVVDDSPTLITPNIGVATATSLTATGSISGSQLTSTIATGTAPLVITSTTPVANLSIGGNAATATTAVTSTNFTGPLSGDVTGTQSSTVVATVGGSTAANVHAGELLANAATNLNTVSTIVKRDATGNFSAGTITASLAGNVTGNVTGNVSGTASNITGIVSPGNGGTGIANNATSTLTISGNFGTTLTLTGATNITLPTSGTLVNSSVTTLSSLASIGTITTGTWNATKIGLAYGGTNSDLSAGSAIGDILFANTATTFSRLADVATGNALISGGVGAAPSWGKVGLGTHVSGTLSGTNGGTGVNNGASTITLGGNITTAASFTTSGANSLTLTTTGVTNVTLPTSGTLATTGNLSQFAVTTSAQLAGILTDETGTGLTVFSTSPTLTTPNIGAATGTSLNVTNTLTAGAVTNQLVLGTTNTTTINSTAPAANRVYTIPDFGANGIIPIGTAGNSISFTTTGATNVTLPTSGTLVSSSVTTLASLASIGTITTGTWNATKIGLAYGGTNSDLSAGSAIGDILFANTATTFSRLADVATGNALISGGVGAAPSWGKVGLGTHVSGTLSGTNGGTGVNNGASTITLGGNITTAASFTTSGANSLTLTTTGVTNVTLPTSGTLATTGNLSQFAVTTSAQLAGILTDETGTGLTVFSTSPSLTTPNIGVATGTSLNLTASSNQIVLQSAGITGALTWTPSATNKTITFPDASGTVALVSGTSWNIGGNSPGLPGPWVLGTNDNSGLNIQSGTGAMNIGADVFAKTITLGNITGTTAVNINTGTGGSNFSTTNGQFSLNTGTGNILIGNDAAQKNITIGNTTGTSSFTLYAGTGAINIGANLVARTTTIGNVTGTSAVNINAGTGGSTYITTNSAFNLYTGTGTINIGTDAAAKNINIGTSAVANNITIGNVTGATGIDINAGTGNIAIGGPAAYYQTIYRNATDGALGILGGSSEANGAYFKITGSTYATSPGPGSAEFDIRNFAGSQFALWSYDGAAAWTSIFRTDGATGHTWLTPNMGHVGIGIAAGTAPTALLQIDAGTAAAGTAPLKFTSGALLTTPEAGAIEFLTDKFYGTITTGGARKTFAFLESPSFTTPNIGSATGNSLAVTGALTTSGSSGIGYATGAGAGGTVTQLTNKSTGVIINTITGQIIMSNATLNNATNVSFTVTNSTITSVDVPVVVISGYASGGYLCSVNDVSNGSFRVTIRNVSGASLSDALTLNFAIIKGANN